jgi:hypothetical protein
VSEETRIDAIEALMTAVPKPLGIQWRSDFTTAVDAITAHVLDEVEAYLEGKARVARETSSR